MRRLTALVDHAAMRLTALGSSPPATSADARMRVLQGLQATYHREDWLEDPDAFFGPMRAIRPDSQAQGQRWGAAVTDLSWPSDHQAIDPKLQSAYHRFPHNRRAAARWFQTPDSHSAVIAIHGYGGGGFGQESYAFPVRRWTRSGRDVVLFALPFHGPRRAPGDRIRFPSALPAVTIECFRHAVADLRDLIRFLRERGAQEVAVVGMSLGGYTAALLATVEADLDFCLPFIPLTSLADYAAYHGRLVGTPEQRDDQVAVLERIYAVTSPLGRRPLLPPTKLLVAGAVYDRVTPIRQAESLAAHFDCELLRFEGSHLAQLGRAVVWARLDRRWPA